MSDFLQLLLILFSTPLFISYWEHKNQNFLLETMVLIAVIYYDCITVDLEQGTRAQLFAVVTIMCAWATFTCLACLLDLMNSPYSTARVTMVFPLWSYLLATRILFVIF